ncbi:MAG: ribonucleotide-diphosphate reductase subunit beta, partial [Simplicispira sp.]|nr:ribonucleotide-diphosphate reductase subunit beta [Simplicispira sp.]
MLTWDEEVIPLSPTQLDSGLPTNRPADQPPVSLPPSTLHTFSAAALAHPAPAAPVSVAPQSRRVNAADKRIING